MSATCTTITCEQCGSEPCDCFNFDDDNSGASDFKAEAKASRIARCGQYIGRWTVEKGMIWYKTRCKEHDCPKCQAFRIGEMSIRLGGLVEAVRVVRFEDEISARAMTSQLEKAQYIRLPEEDGHITLIIDTEEEIGKVLTDELAQQLAPLVNTPKGKRISGNLGKLDPIPKKEKADVHYDEIKVREFHIDFTDSNLTYKDIQDYVLERTRYMDPHSKEELQDCMTKLESMTEMAVDEMLGDSEKIYFLTQKLIRVDVSKIDWQKAVKTDRTIAFS